MADDRNIHQKFDELEEKVKGILEHLGLDLEKTAETAVATASAEALTGSENGGS